MTIVFFFFFAALCALNAGFYIETGSPYGFGGMVFVGFLCVWQMCISLMSLRP